MAQAIRTNLSKIVPRYFKTFSIPFTTSEFNRQLEENPHFPSLYGLSSIFNKYNIPNNSFYVKEEDLEAIDTPFISYYNDERKGKDFILVTSVSPKEVTFYTGSNKPGILPKEKFIEGWEKIIFLAEPGSQSKEPGYDENLKQQKKEKVKRALLYATGILISFILIADFLWLQSHFALLDIYILITKLAGTAIAVLLLAYDLDKSNSFLQSICSANKTTNCNAILSSKKAEILGIKWSEIGFLYFTATLLLLLLPGIKEDIKIPLLSLAATAVSPYIIFSIYYQKVIAKQWCPLCLAVQAVLLLELLWSIATFWRHPFIPGITITDITLILLYILIPAIAWSTFKMLFLKAKDAHFYKTSYKRLLYDPSYFNNILSQQETAADGWEQLGITIGNPDAEHTIIKVCNPYCGPCAKAHPILEEVVSQNNNLKLKIIFTASTDENDRGNKPVSHLLAIAENNIPHQTETALNEWYAAKVRDYDLFAKMFPVDSQLTKQFDKIAAMKKWCVATGITGTPTIFIDGKKLPESYRIEELKNIF